MLRKTLQTLLILSIVMFLGALPATASQVKITVNGQPATFVNSYLENGISMIDHNSFAKLSGAQIHIPNNSTLHISKNNIDLTLSPNKTDALLNEKNIQFPTAPVKFADNIFIPLRTLCDIFGYEIKWDRTTESIELTINEIKDGMTAQELLIKTNQASQEINTFSLDGNFIIDLEVADNSDNQLAIKDIKTTMSGQFQYQPFQAYLVQTIDLPVLLDQENSQLSIETYMTEEKLYSKAPGEPWTVQDTLIAPEFWQLQQDIQTGLLNDLAQGTELGGILSFSDDALIDGKEYYVLNSAMNMDNIRETYQQILQLLMENMPSPGNPKEIQQLIDQILEKANLDYFATSFIDKQTLICHLTKFDLSFEFSIDLSQLANQEAAEIINEIPEKIQMKMNMKGEFKIEDIDRDFLTPDVKDAVPIFDS